MEMKEEGFIIRLGLLKIFNVIEQLLLHTYREFVDLEYQGFTLHRNTSRTKWQQSPHACPVNVPERVDRRIEQHLTLRAEAQLTQDLARRIGPGQHQNHSQLNRL